MRNICLRISHQTVLNIEFRRQMSVHDISQIVISFHPEHRWAEISFYNKNSAHEWNINTDLNIYDCLDNLN